MNLCTCMPECAHHKCSICTCLPWCEHDLVSACIDSRASECTCDCAMHMPNMRVCLPVSATASECAGRLASAKEHSYCTARSWKCVYVCVLIIAWEHSCCTDNQHSASRQLVRACVRMHDCACIFLVCSFIPRRRASSGPFFRALTGFLKDLSFRLLGKTINLLLLFSSHFLHRGTYNA